MKKFLSLLSGIIFTSVLLVACGSSYAVAKSAVLSDTTDSNASNTESHSGSNTELESKDLQKRLDEHKTEQKTKLTKTEQTHIKDRCKVAQNGSVKNLDGRVKGIETSRNHVYDNLVDRLNKLVTKLKDKSVDTTQLEDEIAVLKTKIDIFKADLVIYKQDVADLKDMNCTSDPTAFKAALEAARAQRLKLAQEASDIKQYVKDTIKPTLKDIRSRIESQEKTDTNDKSSNNTTEGNQ